MIRNALLAIVCLISCGACRSCVDSTRKAPEVSAPVLGLPDCESDLLGVLALDACLDSLSLTCGVRNESFEVVLVERLRTILGGGKGDCLARRRREDGKLSIIYEVSSPPDGGALAVRGGVTVSPIVGEPPPTVMCGFCRQDLVRIDGKWVRSP